MSHLRRGELTLRRPAQSAKSPKALVYVPVHVTVRMGEAVWNLRSRRAGKVLGRALWGGSDRFGFRLIHFSVQGNHVHLLVEAPDKRALARGMQGLNVRIARGLNRMMKRTGRVLGDRYHARSLRTLSEVRNVRNYLLGNAQHHYGLREPDRFASTVPVLTPRAHLLRQIC